MSGTRNRTSKKIPALAAIALMTALTGSAFPAERAAAASAGQEPSPSGREAKAAQNGSKLRRDHAAASAGETSGEAAAAAFAKLSARSDVPGMWKHIEAQAAKSAPSTVTVWLRRLEAVQAKRLTSMEEQLGAEKVQSALSGTKLFGYADGRWLRGARTGNAAADALLREIETEGYVLDVTEGYYFPKIDYERYRKQADRVSRRYAEYLTIRADETRSEVTKDAGLIVSWQELLERAERQSVYLQRYPDSPESAVVAQMYRQSVYLVLYGTDNVPLFDSATRRIDPDAEAAYERQVRKGGTSAFARMLRAYVGVLEQGGGKLTPAAEKFRDARNPSKS
ncbi:MULTISPECIES: hypothetical protein [Saccharibacillus]|uniref:hypothetical protein n=1 Tax=Saccharibacillus TaxID=456492 RepID=UPI00123B1EA3|nr:hypothetical protein [Saccharibacillus sp. WB 17]MWJ31853.1 hypothetical protein [Saccharibacillus sp. WB 17]